MWQNRDIRSEHQFYCVVKVSIRIKSSSAIPTSIGDANDDQNDTFDNANMTYFDARRLLQVDFASFATILREIGALTESKTGEIFYDLGSGTGKALYVVRTHWFFLFCLGLLQ